jgi:hypothetical protein
VRSWRRRAPLQPVRAARYGRVTMKKVLRALAGIVSAAAAILGITATPRSVWDWWWPGPAFVLVTLIAISAAVYIVWMHRKPRAPAPQDQANLAEILSMLPRQTVNEWRDTDLLGGWPRHITQDLTAFVRRTEIEDRFLDGMLEKQRRSLLTTARQLAELDSRYGTPAKTARDHWRDLGYSSGQLDSMMHTDAGRLAAREGRELQSAADAMVSAYEQLIATAQRRGYDVSAARGVSPSFAALPPAVIQHSSEDLLRDALSHGIGLRTRVMMRPDEKLPYSEDPLFQWAKSTYGLLCDEFPAYSDDFYGPDASDGSAYFAMAYGTRVQELGRSRYLETQIAMLKRVAEPTRPALI